MDLIHMQNTIAAAEKSAATIDLSTQKQHLLSLIDLTDLSNDHQQIHLMTLCEKAIQAQVAAICIWPEYLLEAKSLLFNNTIKLATVANFPTGKMPLPKVLAQITQAIDNGADEIDVVFPYHDFLAGKINETKTFLQTCRATCQNKILKIIVESGAFSDLNVLQQAAIQIAEAGVDFLKTSTGKIAIGATLPAVYIFLSVLKNHGFETGIKISGGIRTARTAVTYLELTRHLLNDTWITSNHFRIGTSQLVDEILQL